MFKDHPKGLIPAALANMGERFGYYIMNAVLVLFLCSKFGLSNSTAGIIYSAFYCGIYILSLVGGTQLAVWCSLIPFTSPIVMMIRVPVGAPIWQIVSSLVILYGTFPVMTWLAARIFRIGVFMHGKKPTWKDLGKWITLN